MGGMGLAASLLTLSLLAGSAGQADQMDQHRLHSPDGRIEVVVTVKEDAPRTIGRIRHPR